MDNITHSLVGWTLAETGLKRRTRKGLAACVLAANMPDIDVFFGWAAWTPLATHRGFTHGLVGGVLLMPPLLAGLLWLFDRWQQSRGAVFRSGLPMRFGWLMALCYVGALTHPLLDLQNTYAVQLLSPQTMRWFHTDGLFIIDPWLWLMMGLGLWQARRWRRPRPAQIAFAGIVAYIALNIGISQAAGAYVRSEVGVRGGGQVGRIFAAPQPGFFWRRDVLVQRVIGGSDQYQHIAYDPLSPNAAQWQPLMASNMAAALARRAAIATPDVRKFLAWSQMPFATIDRQRCTARVTFGDARFSGPRMAGSFSAAATVTTNDRGCPAQ